ncbi:hypothetical protein SAMN05216564_103178 [Halopenitus persicus]|uniref:Uncharacterized protein n=1 Tax=Halopenitus persicus TaxID=1048396 RepID=A0A1H3HB07_9EURY|nr:hypothetical protein SAMN05216564_103178 [Halopenitus persicus]
MFGFATAVEEPPFGRMCRSLGATHTSVDVSRRGVRDVRTKNTMIVHNIRRLGSIRRFVPDVDPILKFDCEWIHLTLLFVI